jgi:hypothetical protein
MNTDKTGLGIQDPGFRIQSKLPPRQLGFWDLIGVHRRSSAAKFAFDLIRVYLCLSVANPCSGS